MRDRQKPWELHACIHSLSKSTCTGKTTRGHRGMADHIYTVFRGPAAGACPKACITVLPPWIPVFLERQPIRGAVMVGNQVPVVSVIPTLP
jgi:hypothetical protein